MNDDRLDIIEAEERATATLLQSERPVPDPNFRGTLRRRLEAGRNAGRPVPFFGSLGAQIAGCFGAGVVLLAVAAAGLVGVGPFGA
jgi:hypothetical protein